MKNKILIGLVALLIATNATGYAYYDDKLSVAQKTISNLQQDVKTKSTEIANLEVVVESQDQKLKDKQKVIDTQKTKIENQKRKLDLQKKEIDKLKANFKREQKGDDVGGRKLTVEATAYIAHCSEGCTGRTATGVNVSNSIYHKGYRVIAVDTSLIPLNSLVRVDVNGQSFTAMAIDTGGGIDGHEIDLLVSSTSEARKFGRQTATLTVLREGE